MKTVKEQFAKALKEIASGSRQRRFHEILSVPWFEMSDKVLIEKAGDVGFLTPESWAVPMPFEKMVVVINGGGEGIGPMMIYYEGKNGCFDGCWLWLSVIDGRAHGWSARMGGVFGVADASSVGPEAADLADFRAAQVMRALGMALDDAGVHVAVRRPVNEMKSVEWCRSQEHFVFLRSNHPANRLGEGRSQDYCESDVIRRMAHRVRAHSRVLRSPKFRLKQGQVIWIQEQWRGPKEWINKRSRQVYRWVDKKTLGGAA